MFFGLVLLLVLLGLVFYYCENFRYDVQSPLNFALFRPPSSLYDDQFVNLWIEKPWKSRSRIPCRIETYYDDAKNASDRSVMIVSHSATDNLLTVTPFLSHLSKNLRMDIVSWDYPGYGLHTLDSAKDRSAEDINNCLEAVVDRFQDYGKVYLLGHALGTGPALAVAAKSSGKVKGVVTISAFSSVLGVMGEHLHEKIVEQFKERWDNTETVQRVKCPTLLLHGDSDNFIPASHSKALKAANPEATFVSLPNATHTKFSWNEVCLKIMTWMS